MLFLLFLFLLWLQMDSSAPPGLSLVSVLSLLACSGQVLVAVLLTRRYCGRGSTQNWWILLWLFYDVIVHLTLVGGALFLVIPIFIMMTKNVIQVSAHLQN